MKKIVKLASLIVISFLVSVGVDRAIGMLQRKHEPVKQEAVKAEPVKNEPAGLLFPPHSKVFYKTDEFSYEADINGIGFRDREFNVAKGANYRVVAIGDSFTYGWGVNLEQSWPKVLERNLQGHGLPVEIANLGRPGASPKDYADTAEKAIPLLKPDLVIVAVLQGEDLAQLKPKQTEAGVVGKTFARIAKVAAELPQRVYPNLMRIAAVTVLETEMRHPRMARWIGLKREQSVASEWRSKQQLILDDFTAGEKKRYEALDERIKHAFATGMLNPALIYSAIKTQDYFLQTLDPSKRDVQIMIDEMSKQFGRIKTATDRYNARVVVVSVPFGIYVSPTEFEVWRNYGFHLDNKMLVSDSPDQAIRLACEKAGLPFFTVTDRFRSHKDANLFYKLDGHFDPFGHQFYADQLTPIIADTVADAVKDRAERH